MEEKNIMRRFHLVFAVALGMLTLALALPQSDQMTVGAK